MEELKARDEAARLAKIRDQIDALCHIPDCK